MLPLIGWLNTMTGEPPTISNWVKPLKPCWKSSAPTLITSCTMARSRTLSSSGAGPAMIRSCWLGRFHFSAITLPLPSR
ncbi:hypothetical protein D3C76_1729870 [compost metagenome]